jgi:flagellar protein FliJ
MRKFFFRLETLLKVRKVREKAMTRELDYTRQKWSEGKEKEKLLLTQIASLMEEMQKKRQKGEWNLQETYTQILEHLNRSLTQLQENLSAQSRQIEEQKQRLKNAIQERKVIEKIKEKHYAGWRSQQAQTEGTLLDEFGLKKPTHFE